MFSQNLFKAGQWTWLIHAKQCRPPYGRFIIAMLIMLLSWWQMSDDLSLLVMMSDTEQCLSVLGMVWLASNYHTAPPDPQGQECPVYKWRNAINKLTRYTNTDMQECHGRNPGSYLLFIWMMLFSLWQWCKHLTIKKCVRTCVSIYFLVKLTWK